MRQANQGTPLKSTLSNEKVLSILKRIEGKNKEKKQYHWATSV